MRPPTEADRLAELRAGVASLRRAGFRVGFRRTARPGDARRLARSAARAGWDVVVAAGGDGTVNEVVNGLARAERRAALGVVPLGTANDFATGQGLPADMGEALQVAARGRTACLDVARVNRRCFINVSTGGFGADVSQRAGRGLKKHLGGFAYVVRGAKSLLRLHAYRGVFRIDGRVVHNGGFMFFAVGNARQTGGGALITPLADTEDGWLDVMLVRGAARREFIALLPQLRAGTHLDSEHVCYFRARRCEVRTPGNVPVNADGEAVAGTTFRYDLLQRRQLVVLP